MTDMKFPSELPLKDIHPQGWLLKYLMNQRDGLTGHLEAAQFPFNTASWMAPDGEKLYKGGWEAYEQNGYWIDGMLRCSFLINDRFLIDKP